MYFYNNSIPDGTSDIVCGTNNATAGRSCRPLSIGIADPESYIQCRMRNISANVNFWMTCTHELGGNVSRCRPFEEFLAWRTNDTQHEMLPGTNSSFFTCGAVGDTNRWRYVDTCCEQAGGRPTYYRLILGQRAYKSQEDDPGRYAAFDCAKSEPEQESRFNSCLVQHTWVVCNKQRYVALPAGADFPVANIGMLALAALLAVLL